MSSEVSLASTCGSNAAAATASFPAAAAAAAAAFLLKNSVGGHRHGQTNPIGAQRSTENVVRRDSQTSVKGSANRSSSRMGSASPLRQHQWRRRCHQWLAGLLLLVAVGPHLCQCASKRSADEEMGFSKSLQVRCPVPPYPGPARIVAVVSSCVHYHETRLPDVLNSWGKEVDVLIVATDTFVELPNHVGLVVLPDSRPDSKQPLVTSERANKANTLGTNTDLSDGLNFHGGNFEEKWLAALDAAMRCVPTALSVFFGDDDTWLDVPAATKWVQSRDMSEPGYFGLPCNTYQFYSFEYLEKFEMRSKSPGRGPPDSMHCGGGPGLFLSAGALSRLREVGGPQRCLRHLRDVVRATSVSDVVLGVCLYEELNLRCTRPKTKKKVEDLSCHAGSCVSTALFREGSSMGRLGRSGICAFPNNTCLVYPALDKESPREELIRCMKESKGTRLYPKFFAYVKQLLEYDDGSDASVDVGVAVSVDPLMAEVLQRPCLSKDAKRWVLGLSAKANNRR